MVLNQNVAELVGALIGDGYIYRNNRKYQIGFVGHPITDKEYFEHLKKMVSDSGLKDFIEFTGFVPYSNIASYYKRADIFINLTPM